MVKKAKIKELESVVIKFVGDSGDGMQLTGTLFSDSSAVFGNDLATFPDYPAEIRAPHNTVAGVSGFQVHIGNNKIHTYGDSCDVLVAMNPASLKANLKWAKKGATIITDLDAYTEEAIHKAGYKENPLEDNSLDGYNVVKAPITNLTRASLVDLGFSHKIADKSKNMFALGIIYYLFNRDLTHTLQFFEKKFAKTPDIKKANNIVLHAGYDFADTIEALESTYQVAPAKLEKGKYRNITGNIATAWGLLAAAERSGHQLFLGSYPITPATEILTELCKHKSLGAKVFQAEDEIAGITSAIGASFAGAMAVTTTSGPGLSLKTEALGLAIMTELPLVIVDVQRGGPSTGLPTKSEQSDLYQALFGRNGEAPLVVIAASSPANCFDFAYMASKIALEHMTPVMLLTDGFLGNGSQLFKIPKVSELPSINPPIAQANDTEFKPYKRDPKTLVRKWAIPGTEGLRHRIGGLEKENITGAVSTEAQNHQLMVNLRAAKIQKVADFIPKQTVTGCPEGDVLVISWGSTEGSLKVVIDQLIKEGKKVGHAHFSYIMPLPKNTADIFKKFKKIVVFELNMGQFVNYLRMTYPQFEYHQHNKAQGLPFTFLEVKEELNKLLA
jgi:2-oxoglutarate/2-oxoacid ferredoxin oxidoreductase subunit alpha